MKIMITECYNVMDDRYHCRLSVYAPKQNYHVQWLGANGGRNGSLHFHPDYSQYSQHKEWASLVADVKPQEFSKTLRELADKIDQDHQDAS